jgi:hypothetical protein
MVSSIELIMFAIDKHDSITLILSTPNEIKSAMSVPDKYKTFYYNEKVLIAHHFLASTVFSIKIECILL